MALRHDVGCAIRTRMAKTDQALTQQPCDPISMLRLDVSTNPAYTTRLRPRLALQANTAMQHALRTLLSSLTTPGPDRHDA
jgi:hypothetical protein